MYASLSLNELMYRQISNIRCIFLGNEILHHSDSVGALPVGNYILILDLTPGFHSLHKDNC